MLEDSSISSVHSRMEAHGARDVPHSNSRGSVVRRVGSDAPQGGRPSTRSSTWGLFSTYLRPSALLGIRTFDVLDVPHIVSHQLWAPALIVSPEEREARTKQGCFDLTVVLDDVRDPQLGRDLLEQKKERLLRAGVKEEDDTGEISLWSFRAAQFSAAWASALERLALGTLCTTSYQNRHGGPSRDIQLK